MIRHILSLLTTLCALCAAIASCATAPVAIDAQPGTSHSAPPTSSGPALALPADAVLPWETLAGGSVVPGRRDGYSNLQRSVLAVTPDSEFVAGVERYDAGSNDPEYVNDKGEATMLASGQPGGSELAWAQYRIPMGGNEPGVVSLDVNLRLREDGMLSSYYVGLADYDGGHWDWYGPFGDAQVRIATEPALDTGASYLSPLGNLFVTVAAWDGDSFDIVGVAADPVTAGDLQAPPVPAALGATPAAGGLLLEWTPAAASDLAGYRIYWSYSDFDSIQSDSVTPVNYVEGNTFHLLRLNQTRLTYVAVAAIDINGNLSPLTDAVSATPLAGTPPVLEVTTDVISGLRDVTATLTATGAASYDFDLDGDGIFEVTDDATGVASVDTSQTGIVRPAVRGSSGGTSVAFGAVSLIILAGMPPVAKVDSDVTDHVLWDDSIIGTMTAAGSTDPDGGALQYSFDPEGDGTFTAFGANPQITHKYSTPGLILGALKVRDSDGLEDHAVVLMRFQSAGDYEHCYPDIRTNGGLITSVAAVGGNPALVYFSADENALWYIRAQDPQGNEWGSRVQLDNSIDTLAGTLAVIKGNPAVVISDNDSSSLFYRRSSTPTGESPVDWNPPVTLSGASGFEERPRLLEVNGNPAVVYHVGSSVYYMRASGVSGTGDLPADWALPAFTINSMSAGKYPAFAMIAGNPAIAYHNGGLSQVLFARAATPTGAAQADWPATNAPVNGSDAVMDSHVALADIGGYPAVAYHFSAQNKLRYALSNSVSGGIGSWPFSADTIDTGMDVGHNVVMLNFRGRPMVGYTSSQAGKVIKMAWLDEAGDWSAGQHVAGGSSGPTGDMISMALVDGLPSFSWGEGITSLMVYSRPQIIP